MRSRNIKPGFCKNSKLAKCSPLARLLFVSLPMMCDREGRMEYDPERIKVELLPYDTCTIQALCDELLRFGAEFIQVYHVGGTEYLSVTNFTKHQHPHVAEPKSQLPPPPSVTVVSGTNTVQVPDEHHTSTVQKRLIPDSCNLIPLDDEPAVGSGERKIDPVCELVNAFPILYRGGIMNVGGTHRRQLEELLAYAGGVEQAKVGLLAVAQEVQGGKDIAHPASYALTILKRRSTAKPKATAPPPPPVINAKPSPMALVAAWRERDPDAFNALLEKSIAGCTDQAKAEFRKRPLQCGPFMLEAEKVVAR